MSLVTPRDPASAPPPTRPRWEVADVFRRYGSAYRATHDLPGSHLKVMNAIECCRTAVLGGHLERCDTCDFERPAYNSCGNRHCPKCQALAKAKWLEARRTELLPVSYFHNVFTVPHELNPVLWCNKRILFHRLFRSVSEALQQFGRTHLGGQMGFTAILHTWDQKLLDHVHIHCVIPGGALSRDENEWKPSAPDFLLPVRELSPVYRDTFLKSLRAAFAQGKLEFPGQTEPLAEPGVFETLLDSVRDKDWVVFSKRPFAGPEQVLDYLGSYTHRVALGNHRLLDVGNGQVEFTYRDRRDGDQVKPMTLSASEFIGRFLLHVIPRDFKRIRHFGLLANPCKRRDLGRCRELLGLDSALPKPAAKTVQEWMRLLTGEDPTRCPQCGVGTLRTVAELSPVSGLGSARGPVPPVFQDTS